MISRSKSSHPVDPRQRMIDETSAFLTWALRNNIQFPRVPTRRVDEGGFSPLLRHPGARAAVNRWWMRTLDLVGRLTDKA